MVSFRHTLGSLGLVVFGAVGCGGTTILVNPSPPEAKVYLDGVTQGKGPTEIELMDDEKTYALRVGAPGYFEKTQEVNAATLSPLGVELRVDGSYAQTVDGEGRLNKWLVVTVAKHYDEDEAWRKITRAVSTATTDYKRIDKKTLSLTTAWQVAGKRSDWRRTASRIVIHPGERDERSLTFKVMIESRWIDAERKKVDDAERTFQSYLTALSEAQERLAR